MRINDLRNKTVQQLYQEQSEKYPQKITIMDICPPNGQTQVSKKSVSNYGHFFCEYITGSYESKVSNGGTPPTLVDNGSCYLRGRLIDMTTNRSIIDELTPLNLWLSPGYTPSKDVDYTGKTIIAVPLFNPLYLGYLFSINGDIQIEMQNDSDVELAYNICFHGYRVKP